jgi:hypothetical protein
MEKYSSDDMFIPVMPRILDPSLKFDSESLMKSMDISKTRFKKEVKDHIIDIESPDTLSLNESNACENTEIKKASVISIVSKYKYYAIIFVAILVFIVVIYFIYKYFSSKKESENNTSVDIVNKPSDNTLSDDVKAEEITNKENIKNYLSEYIDIISDTTESNEDDTEEAKNWNITPENLDTLEIIKEGQEPKIVEVHERNINTENEMSFDNKSEASVDNKSEMSDDNKSEASVDNKSEASVDNKSEKDILFSEPFDSNASDDGIAEPDDDTDSLKYFNKYK